MKKIIFLLLPVAVLTIGFYSIFYIANPYVTTIPFIQTVPPESLRIGHDRSLHVGDTVTVTGRVVAPPLVNVTGNDRRSLLRSSSPVPNSRSAYIQDTTGVIFGGIVVRQSDTNTT